ncbi:MAG: tetratricopeptide repeat protein, partial [Gammaproteobacteria bacterium]|nr:tetratricopeptide repeat protein [Gammaproteobacteria bacterium]
MKKVLSMAILTASLIAGCGEGEDRQAKYLERAQEFFAEENYDKARIDARNVLQINPKNSAARLILGDINFQQGDIRKAYGMYQSVIDEEAENAEAHTRLSRLYTAVKGYDQAIEHADKALALDPGNAEIMGYKSVALVGSGENEAGEALARETLKLDAGNTAALGVMTQALVLGENAQDALDMLNKGQTANPDDDRIAMMKIAVLEKMGNQDALEKELISLAKKHPDSANYSNTLARYYVRESRFDDAEKEVRAFAKNNSDLVAAKRRVVSYLQQHKSQQAAIEQAQAYIDSNPNQSEFYISLAQLYLFTGEKERGMETLNKAIDADPRSVGAIEARNTLGALYVQDKDYAAAREIFDEVLDIEPQNESALLTRAGLKLSEGELKGGIADLRVILKNNPENTNALAALAQAQEANGNEGLALDNYRKLMALQKPDVKTLTSAARLAIKAEQYADAEKFVRQALELDSENAGLVTNLIRLLVLKEDWDTAGDFAQRLIQSGDSKALGYFLQAGLDLRLEEPDKAIANLKASLKNKPEAIESLTSITQVLSEHKGSAAAMQYVQAHCKKYPKQAHCAYILGTLYAQRQDFASAEKQIKRAISLNDKFVASYRQLAKVYAAQRQPEKVVEALKQGFAATGAAALQFELAGMYYGTQQYEKARDTYEQMIDTNENALAAKNNLAMIYAENLTSPENLVEARALVADLQDTENPAFLDTVGWVMY